MRALDDLTAESAEGAAFHGEGGPPCGRSLERVVEAMEMRFIRRTVSIELPPGGRPGESRLELSQPEIGFSELENRAVLSQLLGRLPSRERHIIELRFVRR